MNFILILLAKSVNKLSRFLNLGAGGTWPGEIVLKAKPSILKEFAERMEKIIIVAGTNGKTTTVKMIKAILEENGERVVVNESGANLLNGLTSSLLLAADWKGKITAKYAIFEVDENTLPFLLKEATPAVIVFLNLFRDQLDRYGEVDTIVNNWKKALENYSGQLILNADDPQIAGLGNENTIYFGLEDKQLFQSVPEHAMDSQFCPKCGTRLKYAGHFYSHIGHWSCPNCKLLRPKADIFSWDYPLPGLYNRYNTLAAVAAAKALEIQPNLTGFHPAFGRQEEISDAKIFLSKNPAGFNESLRTVIQLKAKNILLALNDRIPDGRDVSWIWDVDFEMLPKNITIFVAGDRVLDLAVRLKYAQIPAKIVSEIPQAPDLFVLATYSAMLEIRNKLIGRKIL